MAEVTYAKNTNLWEESTSLQMKLCINEENLNAITAQVHQLQLQTTPQAFIMNTQTMEHKGHNNMQQKNGGNGNNHGNNTTMQASTTVCSNLHHSSNFPSPAILLQPLVGFHPEQQPTYLPFTPPNTSNQNHGPMHQFPPLHQPIMWNGMLFMHNKPMPQQKKTKSLHNHNTAGCMVIAWGKTTPA